MLSCNQPHAAGTSPLHRHLERNSRLLSIARKAVQIILSFPSNLARPGGIDAKLFPVGPQTAVAGSRSSQSAVAASTVRDVALDATGADVDFAGIGGVPVRFNGGLVGEREVLLALVDDFRLGCMVSK